jgi:hypothetical protein
MPQDSARASISPDAELDQLLHPSQFYTRPADVVADELLTIGELRAILSSWASDACAVDSNPPLRQSPFAQEPVTFDEIMDALTQLDRICSRSLKPHRSHSPPAE